jgi:hypothetical protein
MRRRGMPSIGLFRSSEEYYSTFFHELTHSTGHKSRVGREGFEFIQSFGSESYSREELVAEVGAATLCGVTGIENRTIENSAAYLRTRIERLKEQLAIDRRRCIGRTEGRGLYPRAGRGCGMTFRPSQHHASGIRTFYVAATPTREPNTPSSTSAVRG